jgi:hypothetical protein
MAKDSAVELAPEVAALMRQLVAAGDAIAFPPEAIEAGAETFSRLAPERRAAVGESLVAIMLRIAREAGASGDPAIGVLAALYAMTSSPAEAAATLESAGLERAAASLGVDVSRKPAPVAKPGSGQSLLDVRVGKPRPKP